MTNMRFWRLDWKTRMKLSSWFYYGDNYFRCSFTKSCSEGCTVFMVVEGERDTIVVKMKKGKLDKAKQDKARQSENHGGEQDDRNAWTEEHG